MIEVPYITNKQGINALQKLKQHGNGDKLTLEGVEHAPGTLIFETFVAPPPEDGKNWVGVLRFERGESMEATRMPMAKLLQDHYTGDAPKPAPKKAASNKPEPEDGDT